MTTSYTFGVSLTSPAPKAAQGKKQIRNKIIKCITRPPHPPEFELPAFLHLQIVAFADLKF
jgi:hypothetical protein